LFRLDFDICGRSRQGICDWKTMIIDGSWISLEYTGHALTFDFRVVSIE
jgi:hypothetical protein